MFVIEVYYPYFQGLQKTHIIFKIIKNKILLTVSSHIYMPRTVTEDAREQF